MPIEYEIVVSKSFVEDFWTHHRRVLARLNARFPVTKSVSS